MINKLSLDFFRLDKILRKHHNVFQQLTDSNFNAF